MTRLVAVLAAGVGYRDAVAAARRAEAAGFDALLLPDGGVLETTALMAALGAITSRIGLIGAMPMSHPPYTVARRFAALDHVARGRCGWHGTTAAPGEEEGGGEARIGEFLEVVHGLWDGWEEGALLRDKASGLYLDRDRVHVLDHRGAHYRVRGPLNVTRSPQGKPVLALSGPRDRVWDGVGNGVRALAARWGDVLFPGALTMAEAEALERDMAARLQANGRPRAALAILPDLPAGGADAAAGRATGWAADGFLVPADRLDEVGARSRGEGRDTLRGRLGLPVPVSPFAAKAGAVDHPPSQSSLARG